ncbi:ABC transporter ATP-binding protein [Dysgonomonas sp. 511]|uniref:ABC transporter ATP-binding protein n=1 Tax=Dysgonomonas sp. 511 TaxID=2302930 RepID=UPI002107223B|nr:ATP-binding cassette domain-containing protein [Dysgonomonas sp. 511]
MDIVTVEHISKQYGRLTALSDVSFTLHKGSVTGLLGVNGAGKSTLMKILSGMLAPDSGSITFDKQPFDSGRDVIRKQTGYLPEDNPLYDDMYVKEYLGYVAGLYGVDRLRVDQLIEKTGLVNEYKKTIKSLSRGNRQRVGIAQSLMNDPSFLILDEATSGLDPNQRESLYLLFKELAKDRIILFSTHILPEVKEICSGFILLDKGRLVANREINQIDSIENLFHTLT